MHFGDRKLDHLVYCVPDLSEALNGFKTNYGISIEPGGQHLKQGTHNAILKIGQFSYLEILAADKNNPDINSPRWMGIDLIDKPCLTRWCLSTAYLAKDAATLKKLNSEMGEIITGQRTTPSKQLLQWRMSKPLSVPLVEPLPFMIDWSQSETHPVTNLEQHCTLESFHVQWKNDGSNNPIISDWKLHEIYIQNSEIKLIAKLRGPLGVFELT